MVWDCVSALGKGNLHFCDGTINAEKYIEILEHNNAAFKKTSFPGTPMHISTRQYKTTFCTHYKVLAAEEEDTGT
ncbi:putative polyketide synthase 24 [Labeo rohita]|uniref:Polyketide synthase 24 n=1 Tax=Labeo rohita TaxID=84645 RepID=A0ABQ8L4E6_LABRO|nr:putative polyketide synthase 24 [Labeo rohita]